MKILLENISIEHVLGIDYGVIKYKSQSSFTMQMQAMQRNMFTKVMDVRIGFGIFFPPIN